MRAEDLQREADDLLLQLLRAEIAVSYKKPGLRRSGASVLVSWERDSTEQAAIALSDFGVIPEYRRLVRNREYSCMLRDGALLQLTWTIVSGELTHHRLCYHPCPVDLPELDDASGQSILELVDDVLLSEFTRESLLPGCLEDWDGDGISPSVIKLRSPVRFDYSKDATSEGHPSSHLTLVSPSVRIPVRAPLCLGRFLRFVFQHFYPNDWLQHEFIRRWPIRDAQSALSDEELREPHLMWRTNSPPPVATKRRSSGRRRSA